MDPLAIARALRKVEDGDRLEASELALLERVAAADGRCASRLAVAQALINAEAMPEALALLKLLRRDFPREVQVWLATGRAEASLERYPEAERALDQALALNPGDPEALKALAVISMHRGELQRARMRVEQVLQVDPFDGEAQLLHAELASTEASWHQPSSAEPVPPSPVFASLTEFTEALIARLERSSTPYLRQGNQLLVRLGKGGVARLELKSLHRGYCQDLRPLSESVELIAQELAERSLGAPEGREALLARVMPVLREGSFLERAQGAVRREGPAGLWVFYVLDDSELIRYLPEGTLRTHQVGLEEIDDAAWKNLAERPARLQPIAVIEGALHLASAPGPLWALAAGDGHDGARLLLPTSYPQLTGSAGSVPLRVFLGRRELTLLCREDDLDTVQACERLEVTAEGIGVKLRLDPQGKLETL